MTLLAKPPHTLYLCYFGLREPLVQTQVLPYLRQLVQGGVEVSLLTFEAGLQQQWTPQAIADTEARLAGDGIYWSRLPYHKSPSLPATLYDIAAGARLAARLVRTQRVSVLHARGHVAAMIGALAKRVSGAQLIFDIRGFMPEEYVDAGVWPAGGHLYRLTKAAERRLLAVADGFVVLTEQARRILFPGGTDGRDALGRPVEVIPCCVDLQRFSAANASARAEVRRELNIDGRRVVVYAGALGGWYLTDEMAECLAVAHHQEQRTFTMILTQSRPEMIVEPLRARGVAEKNFVVRKVTPEDVPKYLSAADAALSFIKPCYSKRSSSPTKIAEYLASGLPIIANRGIGDVDEVIDGDQVGVMVSDFNREAYAAALRAIDVLRRDETTSERCRASARRHFDLEEVGGAKYQRLYRNLLSRAEAEAATARRGHA